MSRTAGWALVTSVTLALCVIFGLSHDIALAVVAVGPLLAITGAGVTLYGVQHARLSRRLWRRSADGTFGGLPVRFTSLDGAAGVAGLMRPCIYCDPELSARLTDEEQRAVALHEDWHRRRRDPLRLVALAAVRPLLALVPVGRAWLEVARARIEIAADHHAVRLGASRQALASALLTVQHLAPETAAGFASAVELRLRVLLAEEPVELRRSRRRVLLLAALGVVAAVTCAPVFGGVELSHLLLR